MACVSDEVAEEVARRGIRPERIRVIPNGVDVHTFTPDIPASPVRRRYGLDGRFVVGWIGGFHYFHGLELAIEAVTMLRESIPELVLLLVGDGLARPRLEGQVRGPGLDHGGPRLHQCHGRRAHPGLR